MMDFKKRHWVVPDRGLNNKQEGNESEGNGHGFKRWGGFLACI